MRGNGDAEHNPGGLDTADCRTSDRGRAADSGTVKAADDGWGEAEIRGDAAYVERLPLPAYRSIASDGKITTRAQIIAGATAGHGPEYAKEVADCKAQHPSHADIRFFGDTAVLNWVSDAPGGAIYSCDIFVYRDGHWRAIYSQHTGAEG